MRRAREMHWKASCPLIGALLSAMRPRESRSQNHRDTRPSWKARKRSREKAAISGYENTYRFRLWREGGTRSSHASRTFSLPPTQKL
uniref:Uncharacterized protein n=1 Tax=Leptobrachium leishanense TaxID=445787 RepID=A0A8C5MYQ9_9ANUR